MFYFIKNLSGGKVMIGMMKEYYKSQAKSMYEIRSIRHDIQAHMIVLQYYLDKGKYQDAKEYLQAMREYKCFHNEPIVDTGNDLVNAIAVDILGSRKNKIKLDCTGYIPENIRISDFDLCTLFSNLFTNGVEACDKLIFHEKKITMKMEQIGSDFKLLVSNPIEWEVDKNILGVSTTKKDKENHGYGVKNIIRTVRSYDGEIEFGVKDGIFRVNIMFGNIIKDN